MASAAISGTPAMPKGLRHGFGVHAVQARVPVTLVQRWLGHASLRTTSIYIDVTGADERAIAGLMRYKPETHFAVAQTIRKRDHLFGTTRIPGMKALRWRSQSSAIRTEFRRLSKAQVSMSETAFRFLLQKDRQPFRPSRCFIVADPKVDDRRRWTVELDQPKDDVWFQAALL